PDECEREAGECSRGDGERARVRRGERAVGEVKCLGVGRAVEPQVRERRNAVHRGLRQRALQRAGARAEADRDRRRVARDGVGELVLYGHRRLRREGRAGGGACRLRGDGQLVGGGGGDGEGGGVGEGEGAVGEAERLRVRGVVDAQVG